MEHKRELIIEAGTAFGSGAHPSTALALRWLESLGPRHAGGCMLDMGCGSGVLAVAMAKFHRGQVLAVDRQHEALMQTRRNAEANGVTVSVTLLRADRPRHGAIREAAPFDLICCNILAEVMLPWLPELAQLLAPHGHLILSGVLAWQQEAMEEGCRQAGLACLPPLSERGWMAWACGAGDER